MSKKRMAMAKRERKIRAESLDGKGSYLRKTMQVKIVIKSGYIYTYIYRHTHTHILNISFLLDMIKSVSY